MQRFKARQTRILSMIFLNFISFYKFYITAPMELLHLKRNRQTNSNLNLNAWQIFVYFTHVSNRSDN